MPNSVPNSVLSSVPCVPWWFKGWLENVTYSRSHPNERGYPLPGQAYTLTRSIDWMQVELAELHIRHSRPDVLIEPRCGTVKLFDYDRSDEIIEAGRVAAREALPAIRARL